MVRKTCNRLSRIVPEKESEKMQIALTKKLAEKMKLPKLPQLQDIDSFYTWRANITQSGRQRLLVFMNDASRYVLVVHSPKVKTFQRLNEVFVNTLRSALLVEQVNPDVIDCYIADVGEITYVANSSRQETAWLNTACDHAWYGVDRCEGDDAYTSVFASHVNIGSYSDETRDKPSKAFLKMLLKYGLPLRRFCAFDLNVRLDLDGMDAVRRLRVPANMTFDNLHKVLQSSFSWGDYHLYSFGMFEEWSENYYAKPDVELIMYEDDFYDDEPNAIMMTGIKLSEYIPRYRKILYTYDFGDDWHHYIEVENIIEDCDEETPKLLSGEGDSPPEDVGGTGGYSYFCEVMANPEREEHEHFYEWSRSQWWWKPFDFDSVARRVKNTLWW